jgi:dTDP-4-amino-4,6-dideoxygalactose transaminase
LINDSAQAAGAKFMNRFAGTLGDVGIYSLNRHKNIQCGEGGIAVCFDNELALRMRLIRNHGENLTESPGFIPQSLVNMLGFNFRMTEIEAAIAAEQLKKLSSINDRRIEMEHFVSSKLKDVPGLTMPAIRPFASHIFYMQAMLFDARSAGVSRDVFVRAVNSEGIPLRGGYLRPLYQEPLYQKQIAIGESGFPFRGTHYKGTVDYRKGLCPVAEDLFERKTIINPYLFPPLDISDMQNIVDAVIKVAEHTRELKAFEEENVSAHSSSGRL